MKAITERIRADERWLMQSWQGQEIIYQGRKFVINTGVYVPQEASHLLIEHFVINPDDQVLDIGTGSGFLAIMAAYQGAGKVVAVDLNPRAVANARYNVNLHNLGHLIEVRLSDMFQAVRPDEAFEVMLVNLPFVVHSTTRLRDRALWDPEFVAHRAFFRQVKDHLKPQGRIYLAQANFGEIGWMKSLAHGAGLNIKQLGQVNVPFIDEYRLEFYLFELRYA